MHLVAILVSLLFVAGNAYGENVINCEKLDAVAGEKGVRIPGYMSGRTTLAGGRIYFYSAPSESCKNVSVFILPNEKADAYIEYQGFTAILYMNPKTLIEAVGWVKSDRLSANGFGIAPKQ
jgi:hypothetical protein